MLKHFGRAPKVMLDKILELTRIIGYLHNGGVFSVVDTESIILDSG